ncbi:hypothetical protein Pmani_018080 [Petrolisthes manimaculis]|uniref:Uncharacterized protein n=1 Tax=Petrolisthes manimaculis TaxID=1843537 RepID=A0AAE1PL54_9EUCA|nr:hypothetical protein Pmani_018080 [Petrolisthes manimaculis]
MSVALPQYQPTSTSNVNDQQGFMELRGEDTADMIKYGIQDFGKAFSSDGSTMTKITNIIESLLPLGRAVIIEKSLTEEGYDTERRTKQQEDIEILVPAILDTVETILKDISES